MGAPVVGIGLGSLGVAVAVGVVYGLVLLVGGMGVWMRAVIGVDPIARRC